jgi:hypothetical protein
VIVRDSVLIKREREREREREKEQLCFSEISLEKERERHRCLQYIIKSVLHYTNTGKYVCACLCDCVCVCVLQYSDYSITLLLTSIN